MKTFEDPHEPLPVAVGERFAVELPVNATTGFLWNWTGATLGCHHLSDVFAPPVLIRPGAAGRQRIEIVVDTAGEHTVQLTLAQPWALDEPADSRILVIQADARC